MSKRSAFPKRLTVTREYPTNDEPYLTIQDGGVRDIGTDGEPVAIYELVTTGTVAIEKTLIEDAPKRTRRRAAK